MQEKTDKNAEISERMSKLIDALGISPRAFATALGYKRPQLIYNILNGKSIPDSDFYNKLHQSKYGVYLNIPWLQSGYGEVFQTKSPKKACDADAGAHAGFLAGERKDRQTPAFVLATTPSNGRLPKLLLQQTFELRTDRYMEIQQIPLYELDATAGLVSLFAQTQEQLPLCQISLPNLPTCDGALFVRGDSMYPILKSGDIILYKTVRDIENGIMWGEMYLISFEFDDEEFVSIKYIQKSDDPACVRLASHNPHYPPKDIPISKIRALALIKASVRYNTMR